MREEEPDLDSVRQLDTLGAVGQLERHSDEEVAAFLCQLGPARAATILAHFPEPRRLSIARAAAASQTDAWELRERYPMDSIGRLLDRAPAAFRPEARVADTTLVLRDVVRQVLVTYIFVVDPNHRLLGVVTFRDLLFADPAATLESVMLRNPFSLRPETGVLQAMHDVVTRHFPVYPVCDADGRLLGIVRGPELFEEQAFQISAQAGAMVGVDQEERLATPWWRSFRFRHPWLQLNLITAFLAGAVVGFFQDTVNSIVLLAAFLPVLAGQCGNTGSQALAVVLRGMTLGEERAQHWLPLVAKEAWLGALNGFFVGLIAATGMFVYAAGQHADSAVQLSLITLAAMTVSCTASGIFGAGVPLVLRRLGADPATASTIFLSTATDVVSMGVFLGLATWWLL